MTTNQNANGNVMHPFNPNEIKGTILNDDIESRLNFEEITVKEYLDIAKKLKAYCHTLT